MAQPLSVTGIRKAARIAVIRAAFREATRFMVAELRERRQSCFGAGQRSGWLRKNRQITGVASMTVGVAESRFGFVLGQTWPAPSTR
jgi:hypothetical protein